MAAHRIRFSCLLHVGSPANAARALDAYVALSEDDVFVEALRDLARWLYRRLEEEYEHQTSAAEIDAALEIGAFTFTQDGRRFG